jgi:hypothetical protein
MPVPLDVDRWRILWGSKMGYRWLTCGFVNDESARLAGSRACDGTDAVSDVRHHLPRRRRPVRVHHLDPPIAEPAASWPMVCGRSSSIRPSLLPVARVDAGRAHRNPDLAAPISTPGCRGCCAYDSPHTIRQARKCVCRTRLMCVTAVAKALSIGFLAVETLVLGSYRKSSR